MRRLNYLWRLAATGFGFLVFSAGGLVLGALTVPVAALIERDRVRRARLIRRTVHVGFGLFIGMLRVLGVLTYEVHRRHVLSDPGRLLIANHPTLLDVVFLVALVDDAVCVVKESLFSNFWLGHLIRAAGYVSNTDPVASIDDCVAALHAGSSAIIFPEGTRTPPGEAVRLQRGAAYIALKSGRPMTPVTIRCEPATLGRDEAWYQIPERPMHYIIRVGSEIAAESGVDPNRTVAARHLTNAIRESLFGSAVHERT
jgi:1-acyl-sn-glycerol-3-phosphate acyltransferase